MSTKEIGNDELVLFLHPVKSIQDLISNVLVQLKRGLDVFSIAFSK